jgi:hypothetical protein
MEAITALGGSGSVVDVCREVWASHERELRASGDLFFTWQYDIRWAAQILRDEGVLMSSTEAPRGTWALPDQKFGN